MGLGLQDVGLGALNVSLAGRLLVNPLTSRWMSMGYPMRKDIKIKLIFLFYEILCESLLLLYESVAHDSRSRAVIYVLRRRRKPVYRSD